MSYQSIWIIHLTLLSLTFNSLVMTALSDPMEIVGLERSHDSNIPTHDTLSLMTSSSNKHSLQSFYPNELSAYQSSHLPTSLYNNRPVETMGNNNNSLEQHSLYHQPVQHKSPLESVMEQQTQLTKGTLHFLSLAITSYIIQILVLTLLS